MKARRLGPPVHLYQRAYGHLIGGLQAPLRKAYTRCCCHRYQFDRAFYTVRALQCHALSVTVAHSGLFVMHSRHSLYFSRFKNRRLYLISNYYPTAPKIYVNLWRNQARLPWISLSSLPLISQSKRERGYTIANQNITEPHKGHRGKKNKVEKKKKTEKKKMVCEISQKLCKITQKNFARYRKPTSRSEFNFRSEEQLNTTKEFERFMDVYFELGLKYSDIKSIHASRHDFHISERYLKRILRDRGHSRRKAYSDLSVLVDFISDQLQYSGQLHGYRWDVR